MLCTNTFVCVVKWIFLVYVFMEYTQAESNNPRTKLNEAPNFLIIVGDDLGWSDVSPFGSEISTPNLQKLADNGTKFTDFHTASACSATRAMLMSGTDHHIAGLGQMAETMVQFPDVWTGKPGYEGYLNDRVAALPEILQDAGYFTTMSGKWHLGLAPGRLPVSRGFEDSFALLTGGGGHYLDESTAQIMQNIFARNFEYVNYTTLKDFYSSDYFATQLIDSLKMNAEKEKKPFFAYLPFTAPHWPLQAPAELIAKYKGKYDEGPSALRQRRLDTQRQLDLLPSDVTSASFHTDEPEWDQLTPSEQAYSVKTMEIYAAMVERMDLDIGRVLDYLKDTDQFENTFILFISDNGAEGINMGDTSLFSSSPYTRKINNSYENIGNKDSFVLYGTRWAQASTAPSRLHKGHITEGGIRCPAIVHYPKINRTWNISHEFTTVMDILPTILELANVSHPGTTFRNRTVVKPKGKSWIPYLLNSDEHVHHVYEEQDFTGWELFGEQAIRQGNYKAILIPNATNTAEWELYDLTQDKGELVNLAGRNATLLKNLTTAWDAYQAEVGVILPEDRWALRVASDLSFIWTLLNLTSQTTTTTPHTGLGAGVAIVSVNYVLFFCVLLLCF